MKSTLNQRRSPSSQGCIPAMLSFLIAIGLTIGSIVYQRPSDPICRGLLSAGFPVAVVCDASGESPLSSVGKIDWADLDSINYLGSFVDLLSYTSLLWVAWLIVFRALPGRPRQKNNRLS